ncbi:ABC transporter substrate-binding protein [Puniceibacterium sp. IMCC21224]|uniref:substrate-binding periplasmic protein n=1 Tax=Puniceibacterium sp. IMCC21224 TaxID=1618204 RepID=UPI0009E1E9D2|nr:transporter substrate-binding domain-containing protein [Puniceibacterium sp. IMCC21224]
MTSLLRACAVTAAAVLCAPAAVFAADPCADFTPQPKPQNAGRDVVGQDVDTIIDRGWIRFAVYADYPPYSWQQNGTPRGVDVDIARLVADAMGVEARFDFVGASETLDADLRNYIWKGPVVGGSVSNVMMRVPYDSAYACRVEQVTFTGIYASESIAIAYDVAHYPDGGPVPAYFRFDSVAVENDSIADFYLTGFAGGQLARGVHRYPDMQDAMAALSSGAVMAAMGPKAQLEYGLAPSLAVHQPPLAGFARSKWLIGVALHFGYKPLGYAVDDAIRAALEDGRIPAIYADYGLTFQPPEW